MYRFSIGADVGQHQCATWSAWVRRLMGAIRTVSTTPTMRLMVSTRGPPRASPRRITHGFILRRGPPPARRRPALAADSSLNLPDSSQARPIRPYPCPIRPILDLRLDGFFLPHKKPEVWWRVWKVIHTHTHVRYHHFQHLETLMNLLRRLATAPPVGLLLATLAVPTASSAAIITQSEVHQTTFTSFNGLQSQVIPWGADADATSTVNPFNSALGTLDSVTIDWIYGGILNAMTGSSGGSGSVSVSGQLYVNAAAYRGVGSGGSNSAGANAPMTATQADRTASNTFTAASTGVNPAIWTSFTGVSPYVVKFASSGNSGSYSGLVSGTLTTHRDVTVTYNYTPAVPEPSTCVMALAGLACGGYSMFRRRKRA